MIYLAVVKVTKATCTEKKKKESRLAKAMIHTASSNLFEDA